MLRKPLIYISVLIYFIINIKICVGQQQTYYKSGKIYCDTSVFFFSVGEKDNYNKKLIDFQIKGVKYKKFELTEQFPQKVKKKIDILSNIIKHKFSTKFQNLIISSFVETKNTKIDTVKYRFNCIYPTKTFSTFNFVFEFDNSYNLITNSIFIDSLLKDNFFTNLNPCIAYNKALENKIFKEYYKKFQNKVKKVNFNFDFEKNIWIYYIIGKTLDEKGEDGWSLTRECCYGKTIIMNATTYEIIEVIDHFYRIHKSTL